MKRLGALLLFLLATTALADQEYLVTSSPSGGYIGLTGKSLTWADEGVSLVGFQAGWHVHEKLSLGIEAATLANRVESSDETVESVFVTTYGAHLEGRLYQWRFLTAALNLGAGSGTAGYRLVPEAVIGDEPRYEEGGLRYLSADLNLIIALNERADFGLGYGVMSIKESRLPGYDEGDLSSGMATVMLRKKF